MSAPERIGSAAHDEKQVEPPTNPAPGVRPRPVVKRTMRRFEVGFFLRKVHFGRLVYYKQLLLLRKLRGESGSEQLGEHLEGSMAGNQEAAPGPAPLMMAASSHRTSDGGLDDGVHATDGTGMGDGNPGPIGGTRYEIGGFGGTVTEETDSSEPA